MVVMTCLIDAILLCQKDVGRAYSTCVCLVQMHGGLTLRVQALQGDAVDQTAGGGRCHRESGGLMREDRTMLMRVRARRRKVGGRMVGDDPCRLVMTGVSKSGRRLFGDE